MLESNNIILKDFIRGSSLGKFGDKTEKMQLLR